MIYKVVFISILALFLAACDSPEPNPELRDPIYSDLEKEVKAVEAQLSAALKELEGFQAELAAVVPQTGRIKYAQKRVNETNAKIEKLRQMSVYWKLRVQSRLLWDQEQSMKAFKEKKPWPPPDEYSDYKKQLAMERAPKTWNPKERLEQSRAGLKAKPAESQESH